MIELLMQVYWEKLRLYMCDKDICSSIRI